MVSVEVATDGTAVVSKQQAVPLPSDQQQREDTEETTNLLKPDDQQGVLGLEPAGQKAAWRDAKPFMVAWLVVSIVSGTAYAGGFAADIALASKFQKFSCLLFIPGLVAALIGVRCFFCHLRNTGSQQPRILWAWVAAGLDAIPVVVSTGATIFAAVYGYISFPEPEDTHSDDDEEGGFYYSIGTVMVDASALFFLPIICHCFMSLWVATSLGSVHRASFKI